MSWLQLGIDIDGEEINDYVGTSVSLSADGTVLAIGAVGDIENNTNKSGKVLIYKWNEIQWGKLGNTIIGEADGDQFGTFISLSSNGTVIAIGSPNNSDNGLSSGSVRVYDLNQSQTQWIIRGGDIDGEANYNYSGASLSLSSDGNVVAIGATGYTDVNGTVSGHIRVYKWDLTTTPPSWQKLGNDIDVQNESSLFSTSVSLSSDGTIIAIGVPNSGDEPTSTGKVSIYYLNGTQWARLGNDIVGENSIAPYGTTVSLSSDGTVVAIGNPFNDNSNGVRTGQVSIYKWNGTQWTIRGSVIDGEEMGELSGWSVSLSLDGNTVSFGAPYNNGNGPNSGEVRVYYWNQVQGDWVKRGIDIEGEDEDNSSGYSVALSSNGQVVAIGARRNTNLGGTNSGQVRVYVYPQPLSQPLNLLSEPGNGQITLNWTIPTTNINNSIIYTKYYRIYDSSNNEVSTLGPYDASNQSTIPTTTTISELTNNNIYKYYMKTENNYEQLSIASQTVQTIPYSSSNINEVEIQSSVTTLLSSSSDKISDTSSLLNTLSTTNATVIESIIKISLESTLNVTNLVDVSSSSIISNVSQIISNVSDSTIKQIVVEKAATEKIINSISSISSSDAVTKIYSLKTSITEMVSAINTDTIVQSYVSNATKEMAQSIMSSTSLTSQEAVGSILSTAIENVTLKSSLFEALSLSKSNEVIEISGSILTSIQNSVQSSKKSESFNNITSLKVVVPDTSSTINISSIPSGSSVYFPIKPNTPYTVDNTTISYNSSTEQVVIGNTPYSLGDIIQIGSKSFRIDQIGTVSLTQVEGTTNNNVPCIVEGQHILTQRGYVKVEELTSTDFIITSDNRQVAANVYKFTIPSTTNKTAPITIKANAFAPRSPPNDIRLSPLHAIQRSKGIWDISIKATKRYDNVIQDTPGQSVTYYHIETPNYLKDNLVVEGAVIESFGVSYCNKHGLKATDIYRWSSTLKGYTRISPSITKNKTK
jgi:hypothetical protein